jgi:phospholipase C
MSITRRTALKTLGAMAGAAGAGRILPGCGEDSDGRDIQDGSNSQVGILNIVYVMMENRSYDHQLGGRTLLGLGGDGLVSGMSNPDASGVEIPFFEPALSDAALCIPDPAHSWTSSHDQFSGGTNRGFVTTHQGLYPTRIDPMQALTRAHAPVLWALADEYTTCDRYFCSVMGPTWPNRMFWHTGTSLGMTSNMVPPTPFETTLFQRLDAKGIDWRYYYSDLPFVALLGANVAGHIGNMEDFLSQAATGTLPSFSYVEPAFGFNDDHPPHHPMAAQQFLAMVYTALATSPQWKNTLLVITYDEHGGFFDHVPPPQVTDERAALGFDQLGFRVPTYIVGPYAKAGYVSNVQLEHCSAVRHVIDHFGLDPINERVTASNDFSDGIDQVALAAGAARDPITVPAIELNESDLSSACLGTHKRQLDLYRFADENPQVFSGLDRRHKLRDDAYLIGDFLEKHNVGRIVRGR